MRSFPLSKVYQLMEPGPVVLLTTAHKGKADVMTLSWHMMMEFTPPLIGCIVSNRNFSFTALSRTKECVIAIPAARLARTVIGIGNCSGRTHDKFGEFGLTTRPAAHVSAPLIEECMANLECKVADTRLVNRYNMFVLEVTRAWIDPAQKNAKTLHHRGFGAFAVDGKIIRLKSGRD